ncbi:MAG TPA: transcription repressor NadR [Rugosimonospora sp.]|nr:transcription repressor NadR [Rugosimonospora sp.]
MTRQPKGIARSHKSGANARMASGATRRRRIVQWMRGRNGPVPGTELARHFRVSRQCLVQDIAILRAESNDILSTPQGYRLPAKQVLNGHRAVIACQHGPERTEEELQVFVDNGVRVLDVLVEHALYGEMRGSLMIESRADVQDFLRRWRSTKASLLSSLTRGVHLHTVEASKPEMIARARAELQSRGILLK